MSQNKEKIFIHKALTAINKGDATALRKNIKEAILSKVRRAVARREKEMAKNLIESATGNTDDDDVHEETSGSDKVKKIDAEIKTLKKQLDDYVSSYVSSGKWSEKKATDMFAKLTKLVNQKNSLHESINPSTKTKISGHLSKLASAAVGKERSNIANQILNLMGKDSSTKNTKFEKAFRKVLYLATSDKNNKTELEKAVQIAMDSLN